MGAWYQSEAESVASPASGPTICFATRETSLIAVVEAEPDYKNPGDGLQQAKEYAEILGLKFAYSTSGRIIATQAKVQQQTGMPGRYRPRERLKGRASCGGL